MRKIQAICGGWALATVVFVTPMSAQANRVAVTTCVTPMQAAQMLVSSWQMHSRSAASICASPQAVNTLFMTRAASQPNAAWHFSGCQMIGTSQASCLYTFEGGAANFAVIRRAQVNWQVASIQWIAD